jgi:hypothetical protein
VEGRGELLVLKRVVAEAKALEHVQVKAKKKDCVALRDNIKAQAEVKKAMNAKVPNC